VRVEHALLTPRLTLELLKAEAADGPYRRWMNDPEVLKYLEARTQRHDAKSLAAYITDTNNSDHSLLLGMHDRSTRAHIGNIKIGPIDWGNARGEIGIMIGERSAWGKGLGTEALTAFSRYAFSGLKLAKLTAGVVDPNRSSARIFEKAGYHVEAVLRRHNVLDGRRVDVLRFALFSTEPGLES
jgi:ribosomal-protein-alanine N-acetyltransferase